MLFIGADHAGFRMKEQLKAFLTKKKIAFRDCGSEALIKDDDYPVIAHAVARAVTQNKQNLGIALCGSGQGVCIAANKISGVRAATCWNTKSARLARNDDDANILCLPAQLIDEDEAKKIMMMFLKTPFSKHQRHLRRIAEIENIRP